MLNKIHHHAKKHVKNMREKPEHIKGLYSFSVAFVFTIFVFVLWYIYTLPSILKDIEINNKQATFNEIKLEIK